MTDNCEFCESHRVHEKEIEDLKHKYGLVCERLNQCDNALKEVLLLKQGLEFNVKAVDEIKRLHERAIDALVKDLKEKIDPLAEKIAWAQKIVYLMFGALVLSVAGRFVLSAINNG